MKEGLLSGIVAYTGKWSDRSEIMMPASGKGCKLVKILSMRVEELLDTLVGLVIKGIKEKAAELVEQQEAN